jgi:hypothetical protein
VTETAVHTGGINMTAAWVPAFALAMLAALAGCAKKGEEPPAPAAGAAQEQDTAVAPGTDGAPAPVRDLAALVERIVARADALPRAEFDPAALAAKLGKEPQASLAWVQEHTDWAPYRGLLRGTRGVMLDRVGSNLDRAVLLGDLLRSSGHEVRLAHAELDQARAREILGKLRPTLLSPQGPSPVDPAPDARQQVASKANALLEAQAGELYGMVKGMAGGTRARDEQAAVSAMRDYWWVECKTGDKWLALDVLATGPEPVAAAVAASVTADWNAQDSAPAIPEADWHTVQLRLVIERYADGATSESTVLEHVLRPAEVLERPITLLHMPKPWPETLPDPKADPNAIGNAAVSVREWFPVLQVGDQLIAQSAFTDAGDLIAAPLDAKRDIAGAGGAGFMSGFGEALGGGDTASSALTAEWLEYEIRVPGEPARRIRRPVFDLLGPAMRAAKATGFDASTNERLIERYEALLGSTQIFLQVSDLTGDFLTHLETRSLVENRMAIQELAKERDAAKISTQAAAILDRLDSWGPLPVLALWRSELGGPSRAAFINRPNVLSYRVGAPAVNADRIAFREQVDVASNSVGIAWGASQDPFEGRLRQGVADTIAEALALGGDLSTKENTAAIFAQAGSGPDRSKLVAPRDPNAGQGLEWSEDAIGRLGEDVSEGYLAVALRQPVPAGERPRVGWWRIDPESGETIGVMETGFHGGMDERVETELEIAQLRNSLRNWLSNNASRIRAARARANVPWDAAVEGDAELLQVTDRVMDVLHQAALAGF